MGRESGGGEWCEDEVDQQGAGDRGQPAAHSGLTDYTVLVLHGTGDVVHLSEISQ